MPAAELILVPIYLGHHQGLCEPLAAQLATTFDRPVRVHHPWFDPEACFDQNRCQYHSTMLLAQMLTHPPWSGADAGGTGEPTTLGVTGVDLFVPVLTYVFGEAELGGRAALVSTHRLRPEAYGLPPDPVLLAKRLAKEAIHELGHTLGLTHCREASCVMHPSTYAEEIDLKSDALCSACLALCDRSAGAGTIGSQSEPGRPPFQPGQVARPVSPGDPALRLCPKLGLEPHQDSTPARSRR
jgi:archaemetzincin